MQHMKERVTISVEPEALEIARRDVDAGRAPNVSVAVEEALKARGKRQALLEAVRLSEAEYGPISEEAREWARKKVQEALRVTSSSMPGH